MPGRSSWKYDLAAGLLAFCGFFGTWGYAAYKCDYDNPFKNTPGIVRYLEVRDKAASLRRNNPNKLDRDSLDSAVCKCECEMRQLDESADCKKYHEFCRNVIDPTLLACQIPILLSLLIQKYGQRKE